MFYCIIPLLLQLNIGYLPNVCTFEFMCSLLVNFPSHKGQKGPSQHLNRGKLQLEKYISGTNSPVIYKQRMSYGLIQVPVISEVWQSGKIAMFLATYHEKGKLHAKGSSRRYCFWGFALGFDKTTRHIPFQKELLA